MATTPQFAAQVAAGTASISTANTNRDGTGTLGTVLTFPATRSVADAVFNSTILVTSATAAFTDRDRGKPITGDGIPNGTVIAAVLSGTSVHLSQATTASGTGRTIAVVGTGGRVDEVRIKAVVSTSAGMVRLYRHDGTTAHLLTEQVIAAVTVAASVPAEEYTLSLNGALFAPGDSLRVSTEKAEAFRVTATQAGDF